MHLATHTLPLAVHLGSEHVVGLLPQHRSVPSLPAQSREQFTQLSPANASHRPSPHTLAGWLGQQSAGQEPKVSRAA